MLKLISLQKSYQSNNKGDIKMTEEMTLLRKIYETVESLNSEFVSGQTGVAQFLRFKQATPEIKDIIQHLTPYPLGRKTLYMKKEIIEVLQSMND